MSDTTESSAPPAIVVEAGDTTYTFTPDSEMSPEGFGLLYEVLEVFGQDQGFGVDVISAEELGFGSFLNKGPTQSFTGLESLEDLEMALGENPEFSPDGFDFNFLSDVGGYDSAAERRTRAASSAATAASNAIREEQERLLKEREVNLIAESRAEEDRRLEFDRRQDSLKIAALNRQAEFDRSTVGRNLDAIARQGANRQAGFDLDFDALDLTRTEFLRSLSTSADPQRAIDIALSGASSPARAFAERVRGLAADDQEERISLEEQSIKLAEQAALDAQIDAQIAERQRLAEITAAENDRLLAFITGNGETERRLEEERSAEDADRALLEYIQNLGNPTPTAAGSVGTSVSNDLTFGSAVGVVDTVVESAVNHVTPAAPTPAAPTTSRPNFGTGSVPV